MQIAEMDQMAVTRQPVLQDFADAFHAALRVAPSNADVSRVATIVFSALARPFATGVHSPARRDVCRYLPEALDLPPSAGPELKRLARAFAALEGHLRWLPRPSSGPHASENWPEGHANAMIFGPGGLETRDDVAIGVSLMAPHVRYPDHNHEPEEIYLVLTPGRFQHGESDWFAPGPGGTLHNVPNITHAMASVDRPFVAFWCLVMKDSADSS